MRFFSLAVLALIPITFAAPILHDRGFLDGLKGAIGNPKLTISRLQVVKGLAGAKIAMKKIGAQADSTGNTGVTSLVSDGTTALSSASAAVGKIAGAIVAGAKPSTDDQKTVALGIKDLQTAVDGMTPAITTPDSQLSSDIADASKNVDTLKKGGQGVLDASGLSLADLGLPADFAL